jgi:hypothetical protein
MEKYTGDGGSRDSLIGIVTLYGLDGLGFELRWRQDFPHPSRPVPKPIQPPVKLVPGLFPGVRVAGV